MILIMLERIKQLKYHGRTKMEEKTYWQGFEEGMNCGVRAVLKVFVRKGMVSQELADRCIEEVAKNGVKAAKEGRESVKNEIIN